MGRIFSCKILGDNTLHLEFDHTFPGEKVRPAQHPTITRGLMIKAMPIRSTGYAKIK
jgi:hypothetical protein